jgi:hypothetical protein
MSSINKPFKIIRRAKTATNCEETGNLQVRKVQPFRKVQLYKNDFRTEKACSMTTLTSTQHSYMTCQRLYNSLLAQFFNWYMPITDTRSFSTCNP